MRRSLQFGWNQAGRDQFERCREVLSKHRSEHEFPQKNSMEFWTVLQNTLNFGHAESKDEQWAKRVAQLERHMRVNKLRQHTTVTEELGKPESEWDEVKSTKEAKRLAFDIFWNVRSDYSRFESFPRGLFFDLSEIWGLNSCNVTFASFLPSFPPCIWLYMPIKHRNVLWLKIFIFWGSFYQVIDSELKIKHESCASGLFLHWNLSVMSILKGVLDLWILFQISHSHSTPQCVEDNSRKMVTSFPCRNCIVFEDLLHFLPANEALAAIKVFDGDNDGKVHPREMRDAVLKIYNERKFLAATLSVLYSRLLSSLFLTLDA